MKKKLLLITLSALMVIGCVFAFASCKKACAHEYDNEFDADCNLCGEIRVVIESVKTIDDEWILITYTDGTTEKVKNTQGCSHSQLTFYKVVEPHTATNKGLNLYSCAKCGKYSTKSETIHDKLGERVISKEPTCKNTGTTVSTCSVCGLKNSDSQNVPALGHAYDVEEPRVVIDDGANVCEDGYVTYRTCTRCKYEEVTSVPAKENKDLDAHHTVKVFEIVKYPTLDEEGVLKGECLNANCGEVTITLPKVSYDDTLYSIEGSKPGENCNEKDIANVSVNTIADFEFITPEKETLKALAFKVNFDNGMYHHIKYVENGVVKYVAYDPAEKNEYNSAEDYIFDVSLGDYKAFTVVEKNSTAVSLTGDELKAAIISGTPTITCKDTLLATFTCADCGTTVNGVKVGVPHIAAKDAVWTISKEPLCVSDDPNVDPDTLRGVEVTGCAYNGCTNGKIYRYTPAVAHKFTGYTLEVDDYGNGEYKYTMVNGVCKCGLENTIRHADIKKNGYFIDVEAVNPCHEDGYLLHTVYEYDEDNKIVAVTAEKGDTNIPNSAKTAIVEEKTHIVNGVRLVDDKDFVYDLATYPTLTNTTVACGATLKITDEVCDDCGTPIENINVRNAHIRGEKIGTPVASTCSVNGYQLYECKRCNVSGGYQDDFAPLALHTGITYTRYELKAEKTPGSGKPATYILYTSGTCSVCGDAPTTVEHELVLDPDAEGSKLATCSTEGIVKFIVNFKDVEEKDAEPEYITVTISKLNHKLKGNFVVATELEYTATSGLKVKADVEVEKDCINSFDVYYFCEACGAYVETKARLPHTYKDNGIDDEDEKPATCTEDGLAVGCCEVCDPDGTSALRVSKVIPAKDHDNEFQYSPTQKVLVVDCKAEGCMYRLSLSDVELKITKPTCLTDGKNEYKGKDENNKVKTITQEIEKLASHVIPVEAEEKNGQIVYPIVTGKTGALGATASLKCEVVTSGYYYCASECGKLVTGINVYKPHDPVDGSVTILTEPTCTTDGTKGIKCKNCDGEQTLTIPALGHKITVLNPEETTDKTVFTGANKWYESDKWPTATEGGTVYGVCLECAVAITETRVDEFGNIILDEKDSTKAKQFPTGQTEYKIVVEFKLPALTDFEYVVETIKMPTCNAEGLDIYTYSLPLDPSAKKTIDDQPIAKFTDFTIDIEVPVETSEFAYVPGESLAPLKATVEETVKFVDAFKNEIEKKVKVTYVFANCGNEECKVHELIEKSFMYDGNLYLCKNGETEFTLQQPELGFNYEEYIDGDTFYPYDVIYPFK